MAERFSFLVQSIWCSVCFFVCLETSFFRLRKFSSLVLLKIFSDAWICNSSPSSIPIILRLGLFIVSKNFWIFCVRNILDLTFSLTDASIYSVAYFIPESLSSKFWILLVMMFASVVPIFFAFFFHVQDFLRLFSLLLLLSFSCVRQFYLFP